MSRMQKIVVAALSALFVVSLTAGAAVAQDAPKVKEIDFEEDFIEGELALPNGINIDQIERGELVTLVRARADFSDYLRKDVEDL